jgi:hypothetical protein
LTSVLQKFSVGRRSPLGLILAWCRLTGTDSYPFDPTSFPPITSVVVLQGVLQVILQVIYVFLLT